MITARIRLRRDNDYNYAKIKDTFIPANGEICLVDTARNGLRAVCGDGTTPFGQLEFLNDFIKKGYYGDGKFYADAAQANELIGSEINLYIDLKTSQLYYFDGEKFEAVGYNLPVASDQVAGIVKLYSTPGENTDGTMTQKAITKELNEKVEVDVDAEEELLILSYDID